MTVIYGCFIIVGIILGLVFWCRFVLKNEEKRIAKHAEQGISFDERQQIARGKASGFSLGVGAMYLLAVYAILRFNRSDPIIDPSILIMGGVWLILVCYHMYCLMTDSLLPLGQYSFPVIGYLAAGVLNIVTTVGFAFVMDMPLTGDGSRGWESLISGFAFLAMGLMHLIARHRDKRDSE